MIGLGRRQYALPAWLSAAIPLALVAYATYRRGYWTSAGKAAPVFIPVQELGNCAFALLVGVIVVEVVRRSRVAWFVLPFLYFTAAGVALVFSSAGYQLGFVTLALAWSMAYGMPPAAANLAIGLTFLAFFCFLAVLQTVLVRGLTGELHPLSASVKELKANIAVWSVWLLVSMAILAAPFAGWRKIPPPALGAMMLAASVVFLAVMVWRWRGQSPATATHRQGTLARNAGALCGAGSV